MDLEKQQKQPKFIVCVRCLTFNHANYIEDAMNGFTMQETNFPYVCTILDDASTDGEQEVIKKYLQEHFDMEDKSVVRNEETDDYVLAFAQHKTNRNCYFVVLFLKYNHYSIKKPKDQYIKEWLDVKYIALCEGDDYWIHPIKLQTQFDALEGYSDCTVSVNRVKVVEKDKKTTERHIPRVNAFDDTSILTLNDYCREEFYNGHWCFHTSSFFARRDIFIWYKEHCETIWKNMPYGDMPFILSCMLNGKVYFIPDVLGCCRWLSGGYNSMVNNNPRRWIADNKRLKKALMDFDDYTEKKYHSFIEKRIWRIDAGIALRYCEVSPFELLKPKYWKYPIGRKRIPMFIIKYIFSWWK